ncbi:peptidoglycan L-alanyl-D-glutamate endopeptidase CwlK [Nitrosomonas aestuarii]|uniref:Peptidoglycan L-alanyl-D-glutamate endopeptidase CwlK n=1 Tax=Nitrosomonas aestuarii TaxID=52441 RepID=A0A1I4DFB5_9PROT|nr:M15 family metallopeptidase [Nitrosomonas aestuarii]SFK92424.1 peptidoglycan L-alanyl-D-glutamate endopeptidase CwlK [Nitrosomonas aestuarii]
MFELSKRSINRLHNVHPDLVMVVRRAIEITQADFTVLEGLRSPDRQAALFRLGSTKTMNSRHLTGHAVDLAALVNNEVSWQPHDYMPIAIAMKTAASELKAPVQWGGDWKTFKDYAHWQLPWREYPAHEIEPVIKSAHR